MSLDKAFRLDGRVAFVVGAGNGIGRAIAERCVGEGGRVLVHGIEREEGERLVEKLGPSAALHLDDLADVASPARIVLAAMEAFGRIDGLVNNAAVVPRETIHTITPEKFDRTLAINVRAPVFLIQAAFAQLKANPALADMAMLRLFRLSVSPVRDEEWTEILKMAGE